MEDVLKMLERFGISTTVHGQTSLISHLRGTHDLLVKWQCSRDTCLAGLCHSIYGTESFSKTPATLDNREYVRSLIGENAERLAYLFGAHIKESLWKNLDRQSDFSIDDRFSGLSTKISRDDLAALITITLANWLEQRPRASSEFQFIRQNEFLGSKSYLPRLGFQDFLEAYGLAPG